MKKLYLMALLPILLLIGTSSGNFIKAQTTEVSIGNGTLSQNTLPFNNFYKNSYSQMTYYQSEIGHEGYIGGLIYENASSASIVLSEVTIWLAHTPDSLVTTSSWVPQDSLRQVFHATNFTLPAGSDDLMITFDSAFYYDGIHHLAIIVSHKATSYESNVKFKYSTTPTSSCLYVRNDANPSYADYPGSMTGTLLSDRPNVSLIMNPDGTFCMPVSNLNITGVEEDAIHISWPQGMSLNPFEVVIMDTLVEGSDPSLATSILVNDVTYSFTGLNPNTVYLVAVRQQCDGEEAPWRIAYAKTTQVPMSLPFECDFESEESRLYWTLDNGSLTNHWTISTGACYGEDSEYGMYITNDALNTYEYLISGAAGNVFAKCLFHFDAGEYNIGFDWKGVGESTWDYMRAMLVPASDIDLMQPGTTVPTGVSPTALPAHIIALDGGAKLNLSATWQHYINVVNIVNEGNYYLVFMWRNDGGGGSNPPIALDNIVLAPVACPGVDSVVVDNITATTATINGYSQAGNSFILSYKEWAAEDYLTVEINSPYVLTGLLPGTYYEAMLQSSCGDDGVSYAVEHFQFGTECSDIALPWAFSAECTFMYHGSGSERFPYCWESINGMSDSYCWKNNSATSNVHSGESALFFSGSSSTTTLHDDWLFTPTINFSGSDEISMWVRTTTSTETEIYRGRFAIYASTDEASNIRDTAHYVQLDISGTSVIDNHVSFLGDEWRKVTVSLPNTLVGDHHLAFVVKDIHSYSFSLDDIYIYPVSTCTMPSALHVTQISSSSATITWSGEAASFTVYYGAPHFDIETALSEISSTNTIVLNNLSPNTTYEYRVVASCADGAISAPSYPETFITSCAPISNEELPFIENFTDNLVGSTVPLDDCWVRGTNYSSVYPYVVGTEGNPNSLYFYSNLISYSYVALPAFEAPIADLMLSCSIRRYTSASYHSALVLGLMGNPYDISTFVPYDTLAPTTIGEWSDFQISLADYDDNDGRFIAFLLPAGLTEYAHLDNIQIDVRGTCEAPTDLSVSNVTSNSIQVSWNDTTANEWAVYYGAPGFSIDTIDDPIITSEHSATILELNAQTTYEIKVAANCGDNSFSLPSLPVVVTTACAAISQLPYSEDFETYGTGSAANIDPCWYKRAIGTTTQYPYPYTTAAINGIRGLYFKAYEYSTTKYNCYAVLPLFEEPLTNLKLKFSMECYKGTSSTYLYSSKLALGVMTNPNDLTTFDTIAIFDMSNTPSGTVHIYEYMFNEYSGEGAYIALLAPNVDRGGFTDSDNTFYIDDIEVATIPNCHRPSQFESTVTATTANLSWTGNSSSYEVVYSQSEDLSDSTVLITNQPAVQLTDLTPYTCYYVNVRGICGDNNYSEWLTMNQRICTTMDCGDGYQNFIDTINYGHNITTSYVISGSTSYIKGTNWIIYTTDEFNEMGLVSNNNRIHSISIEVEDAGTPLPLKVYMAETPLNEFSINFDTMPLNQMTLVYDHTLTTVSDSWNEIMLDTPFNYSDTMNLMIAFERTNSINSPTYFYYGPVSDYRTAYTYTNTSNNSFTYRGLYVANMRFNLCGEVPLCTRPSHLATSSITDNAISLSWNGTASSYQVAYNTESALPTDLTSQSIIVSSNNATIPNLIPHTTYYIYVRSLCGTDTSIWTSPIIVTTHCAPFDLPYSEDFDSYPATTSVPGGQTLNPCWTKGTNYSSEYPYVYTSYAHSAPNSMNFYSTAAYYSYAALPAFNAPINTLSMSFQLHKTALNYGRIYVGVMDEPGDISTFHQLASFQPDETYEWQGCELSFANYTGTGRYIAFLLPDSVTSYAQIDDIEVYLTPTCQSPINLSVTATTSTSATIGWTDRGGSPAMGYQLQYGPQGFELGSGTIVSASSNPTTLNNLLVGTTYDVYVRSVCSATDDSRWSFPISFSTNCGLIALPVSYDFENDPTGSASDLPHCFNRYNDGTSTAYPYITNSAADAHESQKCIYFYASSSGPNNEAMIFPPIDTINYPMSGNQIVFWAKNWSYPSQIVVGIMSNPTNVSTFTPLDTISLTGEYVEYTVPFFNYHGHGNYPTIMMHHNNSSQYAYIDDVVIEQSPSCPRVLDISVLTATATSATIGWTDTSSISQWAISYRSEDATTNNLVVANTNPYTINGLNPMTKYFVNVRPICSATDTAAPMRNDIGFWTTQVPATLPYAYDFEDPNEWTHWQTSSNCHVGWFRGTAVASQGSNGLYVSADNGATRSSDWNRIVNAVVYRDIDFGPDTSSFTLTIKASAGGTIDHNYDAISVLLVDPTDDVVSSNVAITSPWGHVNDVSLKTIRRDTNWVTYNINFEHIAGVQRVAFYWFNQNTASSNAYVDRVGAIDEISIKEQTCLCPYDLNATDLEVSSATLTWHGSATNYQVAYRAVNDAPQSTIYQLVQGNSINISNLETITQYAFQVRSICAPGDTSYWSPISLFSTICERYRASDTIREDFTNVEGAIYNVDGYLPDCWEGYTNGTSQRLPHVISSGSYWYAHNGKSLIMTAGNDSYGDMAGVRLPYTVEPVNSLTLSYWMCTESNTNGYLEVGYLTGPSIADDFVAIKTIHASSDTRCGSSTGEQSGSSGLYDTVSFDLAPDNAQAIAFRWHYNTSFYSVCLDDIVVSASVLCAAPIVTNTTIAHDSVTLTWSGSASNYQLLIKTATATTWSDTITVNTNSHTFTNLYPLTPYMVQLRALCGGENGNSVWSTANFITADLPCFVPTNLQTSNIDYDQLTLSWDSEGQPLRWVINTFSSTDNRMDTVTDNPTTISGLYAGRTYRVAIKSICSDIIASEWSDTLEFTMVDCVPVTNVAVSSITANSAKVSWRAGANESAWEINYGDEGFGQGEGELVSTSSNSYTLNNLESDNDYDLYVRAICSDIFYSVWSNVVHFKTLKNETPQGIDGINGNYKFTIHPNPTANATTIKLIGVEGKVAINIVDMNGRMLQTEIIECGSDCEKRIDVTGLAQGTYFVRVIGDNINSVRKLIVR